MSVNKKLFTTEILIQVGDVNYGGHVGNDRYLLLAQEARIRWLNSMQKDEYNLGSNRAGVLVIEANVQYLKEVFLGETLVISLQLEKVSKCSCVIRYFFYNKETSKKVTEITTKLAFFNYQSRKVVKTPVFITELAS